MTVDAVRALMIFFQEGEKLQSNAVTTVKDKTQSSE